MMSRPEIGLHKKSKLMENVENQGYKKRTQKDYTMSFKLQVVQEIESGELIIADALKKYGIQSHGTVLGWLKKFGNFDRELYVKSMNNKTIDQKNFELEQKLKLLEKQKAFLERELNLRDQKAIMFDAIVQVVKEDYNIDLLKKVTPERCASTLKKGAKTSR